MWLVSSENRDRDTQGEPCVTIEAEIRVQHLPAKGAPGTAGSLWDLEDTTEDVPRHVSEETWLHLISDPQLWGSISLGSSCLACELPLRIPPSLSCSSQSCFCCKPFLPWSLAAEESVILHPISCSTLLPRLLHSCLLPSEAVPYIHAVCSPSLLQL